MSFWKTPKNIFLLTWWLILRRFCKKSTLLYTQKACFFSLPLDAALEGTPTRYCSNLQHPWITCVILSYFYHFSQLGLSSKLCCFINFCRLINLCHFLTLCYPPFAWRPSTPSSIFSLPLVWRPSTPSSTLSIHFVWRPSDDPPFSPLSVSFFA